MASPTTSPTLTTPFKIFVGYDARQHVAYKVCRHSLLKHSSVPLDIIPIIQSDLRSLNLYTRTRDPKESTEFSFTRFLTPYLSNYQGWSLFIDCDFLFLSDIKNLLQLIVESYAIMCVHHEYRPKEGTKMDGATQTAYPRKNWSSMVLYNCGHPKNRVLTPELVSRESGAFLHRFMWLEDEEIGSVPFVWNFLVGHNKVEEEEETKPKALHYTSGGPWFEACRDCEFAEIWLKELEELENEKEKEEEEEEVEA